MPSDPHELMPRRLQRIVAAAAGSIVLLGLGTLGAWYCFPEEMLRHAGTGFVSQANAAAGFVLLGTAMLHTCWHRTFAVRLLSGVLTVLALGVFTRNLALGSAAVPLFAANTPGFNVLMAPAAALCFVLLAYAQLATTSTRRGLGSAHHALPAIFVAALAGSSVLANATGLTATGSWGIYTRIAVLSAAGFLIAASAMLTHAWFLGRTSAQPWPNWAPAGAVVAGTVGSVVLTIGLLQRQEQETQRTVDVAADMVQREVATALGMRVDAVEQMAARWAFSGGTEQGAWHHDAAACVRTLPGLESIQWMDAGGTPRWVEPLESPAASLKPGLRDRDARMGTRERPGAGSTAYLTPAVDLPQDGRSVLIVAPILGDGVDRHGHIVGVLRIQSFMEAVLGTEVAAGFRVRMLENDLPIYARLTGAEPPARTPVAQRTFVHHGVRWTVHLVPSREWAGTMRSVMPLVTLLTGFGASALVGFVLRQAQRSQRTAAELGLVNLQLGREIDERMRIEARVQAALAEVERQKFALDEHAIVSVTDVQGTILYANDRFCAISGYSREELVGANHRVVRSGVHPKEYFAEMYRTIASGRVWHGEFCNRAKGGELYWVEATIVPSLGPNGKPEQYIGIRTDITARKHAERRLKDALRLSEASLGVISRVAGSPAMAEGDVHALANTVTELAAGAIDVERVSVWLLDNEGETARCIDLFELSRSRHSSGQVLRRRDFASEFAALASAPYVDAHDALNDPRTAGYGEVYLKPNGITSMLDVGIRTGGRSFGLLCFEHVNRPHHWEPREISFGCQLADQIGIALLSRERSRAAEDLRRARDAAEAATQAKSDFLAMMSHEIRTPINGVLGMNNLLLETSLDARQRQIANSINTSGESLLTVINDILDFSKIEARKLELDHVDFDLRLVMDEALEIQATRAHAKGLELAGLLEPGLEPLVRGDPGRVRQVLCNLIGNAVKFTERGEVIVRGSLLEETAHEMCVRFEVRDTGIGISAESQQRLFQAFTQADRSTTRRFGGTGLGLVISRQLVEMMGGEIGISSEPGLGSTFHFTVHLEKQPELAQPGRRAVPRLQTSPGRVLVVDDNASCRALLCEQLQAWHVAPERAASAHEALDRLRQAALVSGRFSTVIADIGLPGIDGLALAADVGRDPLLVGTRVILLVPLGSHRQLTSVSGVRVQCVAKPVKASELRQALEHVELEEVAASVVTEAPEEPGRGVRVLLAEDNAINQMVATATLAKFGCTTDVAGNGLEVLEALRRAPYDIIFMDCMMPEMDGYEATGRVREIEHAERRAPVYIVALTANAMVGDRDRCLAVGMNDYVSKPMRAADVRAALDRWRQASGRVREVAGR